MHEFVCWTCYMCKFIYPWGSGGSMIPERVTSTPKVGHKLLFWPFFLKTAWNWKKLDREGVLVPITPLDPSLSWGIITFSDIHVEQRQTKNSHKVITNTREFSTCNCYLLDREGDLWTNPWYQTYWYHHKIEHRKELTMCQKKHSRFVWFSYVPVPI